MYWEPLYLRLFFKVTGIAPIKWHRPLAADRNNYSMFSIIHFAWNLIFLAGSIAIGVYALITDYISTFYKKSVRMKTRTATVVTFLEILLMIIVLTSAIVGAAFNHKCVTRVKQIVNNVGEKLRRTTLLVDGDNDKTAITAAALCGGKCGSSDSGRFSLALICFLIHQTILMLIDVYFWFHLTSSSHLYAICYLYMYIEIAIEMQFAVLAWNIQRQFSQINRKLSQTLSYYAEGNFNWEQRDYFRINPAVTTCHYFTVCVFQQLHWSLCYAIEVINSTFGWQLLTLIFCICVHIIVTPYFLLLNLFFPAAYGSADVGFLILQVGWVITHNIHLLLIVIPSSKASDRAKETAVVICEYFQRENFNNIPSVERKQLEIFVLQLRTSTVQFSACGLFYLQLPIVASVIGAVITYLIILIQFQNSDNIFH